MLSLAIGYVIKTTNIQHLSADMGLDGEKVLKARFGDENTG